MQNTREKTIGAAADKKIEATIPPIKPTVKRATTVWFLFMMCIRLLEVYLKPPLEGCAAFNSECMISTRFIQSDYQLSQFEFYTRCIIL